MVWAGLTDAGEVDTDAAARFGAPAVSDSATAESNIRFKECLAVACSDWEARTGRVYGRTAGEERSVRVTQGRADLRLAAFQSVSEVERLGSDGEWEVVDADSYDARKLGRGRGVFDALWRSVGWECGHYRVTAVWGELEPPERVVFGAIRYASFLYKVQSNPSGAGALHEVDGGLVVENERIPNDVYALMMRDRVASRSFGRRN